MTYVNKGTISPKYIVSSFGDGNYNTNGTSDEDDINQAINDLTPGRNWMEMVQLKGDFTIDGPIIYPSYTVLSGPALITLADGSDCNMIQNANPATHDIHTYIQYLELEGNKANQTAGHNIYHRNITQPASSSRNLIVFENLLLLNAFDDGLHIDCSDVTGVLPGSSGTYLRVEDVWQRFSWDYGFHLRFVADAWIGDCHATASGATGRGCLIHHCGPVQMHGMYFGNGLELQTGVLIFADNLFLDISNDLAGLSLLGAQRCQFHNLNIRYGGSSAFVGNPAIYVGSDGGTHSIENIITEVKAGLFGGAGTNRWDYIIEEGANCSKNTYKNIEGDDWVTAKAYIQDWDARLKTINCPLPQNSGGSTEGSQGILVDAAGEYALGFFGMESGDEEIVSLTIRGFVVAATGAGNSMELEIRVEGAADNESFNTHVTAAVNIEGISDDYAANDIIEWRIRSIDYANLLALTESDAVQVEAMFETGAGGNVDTNAHIKNAMIKVI